MHKGFTALLLALAIGARAEPPRDLQRAIELPAAAQRLRDKGVPASEVAVAVRATKEHGLTAAEATEVIDAGAKGPKMDNFGKFVNEKLDEGLRGRELAEAIHEEQARRGMGKPEDTPGRGPDGEKGPDDEKGGKGKGPDGGTPPGQDGEEKGNKGKGGKGKGGH